MTDLLSASIDTIVKTFNDEMITFLNQLMVIADQIEISKVNLSKVQFSKRTLVQAININSIICINLFAAFILNPEFSDFLEQVQAKNYKYFYALVDNDIVDVEFRDLLQIIKTVSMGIDEESMENIFGYIENVTVLANIYACKTIDSKQ